MTLQSATGSQTLVSNIDYNAGGQLTKIVYGNGTSTEYGYDPRTLRLNHLASAGPNGSLQDFSYRFDAAGNITQITDLAQTATQSFEYDDLDRLRRADGSYGTLRYRYDVSGNLLEKDGVQMAYGLADGAKPHAVTMLTDPAGQSSALVYDKNGNLIERQSSTSSLLPQLLTYDAENRLVDVQTPTEETVTVRLDPGWNFFSLPVIPASASIETVLPTFAQDLEQVVSYEPSTKTFKHYVGNAAFDDFNVLEYGTGYEVFCKNPNGLTVTVTGNVPSRRLSRATAPGWHLLAAISLAAQPVAQIFGSVDYAQAQRYDTASRSLTSATQTASGQA